MDGNNNQNTVGNAAPSNNTIMGVLSYLGPLVIIPYLMSRNNPVVKFHIKQGLLLLGLSVIVWILGSMMYSLWTILNIVNLAILVLSIIGIVNVVQGKQKDLPLIGQFAHKINI